MPDPLIIGFLGDYLRESVFIGLIGVIVLLRFRRYKAVAGVVIGGLSSAATAGVAIVVTLVALVALGYWEPPVGQIIADSLAAGRAFYDLVGEWLLRQTVERLENLAG